MRYQIETLLKKAEKSLSKKEYLKISDRIFDDENDIFDFLLYSVDAYLGDKKACDAFNNVLVKTITAMNDINDCAKMFGMKKIFVFDDKNPKSVLKVANDFNNSVTDFNLDYVD